VDKASYNFLYFLAFSTVSPPESLGIEGAGCFDRLGAVSSVIIATAVAVVVGVTPAISVGEDRPKEEGREGVKQASHSEENGLLVSPPKWLFRPSLNTLTHKKLRNIKEHNIVQIEVGYSPARPCLCTLYGYGGGSCCFALWILPFLCASEKYWV
jgi:hypothetical protein